MTETLKFVGTCNLKSKNRNHLSKFDKLKAEQEDSSDEDEPFVKHLAVSLFVNPLVKDALSMREHTTKYIINIIGRSHKTRQVRILQHLEKSKGQTDLGSFPKLMTCIYLFSCFSLSSTREKCLNVCKKTQQLARRRMNAHYMG